MNVRYKVTYDGGREVESVAKPKDFVAFERQYGMPFHETSHFEHVCYLAWSPLHRTGVEPRAFDEFLSDLDDVQEVEEEAAPLALTDNPLPDSPS